MNNAYKEYNFWELIEEKEIQIPVIQRDYAQGRIHPKTNEVRENFLSALIEKLKATTNEKKLILDFVYGSTETKENRKLFIPLDGQQRLTTLFLLHWYLCPLDELSLLQKEGISKFSYQTRISSKDFCNNLVGANISTIKASIEAEKQHIKNEIIQKEKSRTSSFTSDNENKQKEIEILKEKLLSWTLSKGIINEPWFMWSWKKDPTVKAMLVMLDAIDNKLGMKSDEEQLYIWNNLKRGQVAFHLLPLDEFGLTDELYVKMNARGKELSAFDIFKSTLEEQMHANKVSEVCQQYWKKNVDSCWIDIFWNKIKNKIEIIDNTLSSVDEKYRKKREIVNSVEESYLRYFKRMMVFHLFLNELNYDCEQMKYLPWEVKKEDTVTMDQIRDYSVREDVLNLMPFLIKTRFFRESFFQFMIDSMESLIYTDECEKRKDGSCLIHKLTFEIEEDTLFGEFISPKITYETRVQFYALLLFLKYTPARKITEDEKLKKDLHEWMRIVRNLSTNTNVYNFNTSADFSKSLRTLLKWTDSIYKNKLYTSLSALFAADYKLDGFAAFQLEEERNKARLILLSNISDWEPIIEQAEEHPYFLGQIPFLLKWSNEKENSYSIDKFNKYSRKLCTLFEKGGLKEELRKPETHLFRNAMMCVNEFYLRGNSFINSVDKNRDNSWKRYLRDNDVSDQVKTLLDLWDDNIQPSFVDFCNDIIKRYKLSDWRKCFIEYPQIYNEMHDHCIGIWNWENEEIALLSKIRWSSRHKELKTFYWSLKFGAEYYDNSHAENYPYSAVFYKGDKHEYIVEYAYPSHEYIVSSSFEPQLKNMVFNNETKYWEAYFPTTATEKVEELLEMLNKLEL